MKTSLYAVLARVDVVTWLLIAALFVFGGYLLIERGQILVEKLIVVAPWLLIAACQLIQIVKHGNHGHHGRKVDKDHDDNGSAGRTD